MSVKLRTYPAEKNTGQADSESNETSTVQSLKKHKLFISLNVLCILFITAILGINSKAEIATGIYVILLFIICTLPLIYIQSYRSKEALMLMFLAFYFGAFGLNDIYLLISFEPMLRQFSSGFLSQGELLILLGAICFIIGYITVTTFSSEHNKGILTKDWHPKTISILGITFWLIGFYITFSLQFGVTDRYSGTSINTDLGGFIALLGNFQPLGTLLLIYLYLTTKNKSTLLILIMTLAADFVLGFIGDSKEIAVRGPLLYIFSYFILRNRIPVSGIIIFAIIAGISFNIFAAYRLSVHSSHTSRSDAVKNISKELDSINNQKLSLSDRLSNGLQYFSERISLKHNTELIAYRTGKDIAYLDGYTLSPLLFAFIPRFILPDKQDSGEAGLLFNREFKISASRNTYISFGHLGELYWNYGWTGAVIGMTLIGAIMAMVSSLLRLDKNPTLPRYLLLLMTIYILVLRFETPFALTYTVWLRLSVLLLIMNAIIPKIKQTN